MPTGIYKRIKPNHWIGRKHTEETKLKLRQKNLGSKQSDETKRKIGLAHIGRKHSEETKRQLSELKKGKKFSKEHREKLSTSMLGRVPWNKGKKGVWSPTEEMRRKISISQTGRKHTEETKRRMSIVQKARKVKMSEEQKNRLRLIKLGSKASDETKRKISESHRGEKSYLWKGGITNKNTAIRISFEYKLWRKAVFERDNYACIWCGFQSKGVKPPDIHADHIKPFCDYPELRLAIDNGRTLCVPCHRKTETFGVKAKNYKLNNK